MFFRSEMQEEFRFIPIGPDTPELVATEAQNVSPPVS